MPTACGFATTIFWPLEHPSFDIGYFDVGRKRILVDAGDIEQPTALIERLHRHIWFCSRNLGRVTSGSAMGVGAMVAILKEYYGDKWYFPWVKVCRSAPAFREYCHKHSKDSLRPNDKIVFNELRLLDPSIKDDDILGALVPILGLEKVSMYKPRMRFLRSYLNIELKRSAKMPSNMSDQSFVKRIVNTLVKSNIVVPGADTMSKMDKVKVVMLHLTCFHIMKRLDSQNGDCMYGLFFHGEAGVGKTTIMTGEAYLSAIS